MCGGAFPSSFRRSRKLPWHSYPLGCFSIFLFILKNFFYHVVLVSEIQQHKSAIIIHTAPPSPPPIPSLQVRAEHPAGPPALHRTGSPAVPWSPESVCVSIDATFSIGPLFLSPTVSTSPFSTFASPFLSLQIGSSMLFYLGVNLGNSGRPGQGGLVHQLSREQEDWSESSSHCWAQAPGAQGTRVHTHYLTHGALTDRAYTPAYRPGWLDLGRSWSKFGSPFSRIKWVLSPWGHQTSRPIAERLRRVMLRPK